MIFGTHARIHARTHRNMRRVIEFETSHSVLLAPVLYNQHNSQAPPPIPAGNLTEHLQYVFKNVRKWSAQGFVHTTKEHFTDDSKHPAEFSLYHDWRSKDHSKVTQCTFFSSVPSRNSFCPHRSCNCRSRA